MKWCKTHTEEMRIVWLWIEDISRYEHIYLKQNAYVNQTQN